MKLIDENGRLFGRISIIDVLVILVVAVMAAALCFKNASLGDIGEKKRDKSVEQPITFQIQARGLRNYVADAVLVGEGIYDANYSSGGDPIGIISKVEVTGDPGSSVYALLDGTARLVEIEDTVDLLITVEGTGVMNGRSYSLNQTYDLGMNSTRNYYTKQVQFVGVVANIG